MNENQPPMWQPIETAPKDGTEVLLHYQRKEPPKVWSGYYSKVEEIENGVLKRAKEGWTAKYGDWVLCEAIQPTYWMPIPPLPSTVT